jgi:hypothetical protein
MKAKFFACLLSLFLYAGWANANNMLIQNVTTTGNNAAAKTIQVQFDMSWDNSWRDGINWDAAWVFIKFKDANGLWQHAQLNQTGFANGSGTANTVKVTSDKVGCWVYRSALGSGTFNATSMQLQWNYGLSGLNDVTGLEVRVFSTEMVYVPEGEFNCVGGKNNADNVSFYYAEPFFISGFSYGYFNAPGLSFPVINNRLSSSLTYYQEGVNTTVRIKGDAGVDTNNDGIIDNTHYPTGFRAFYFYKYELTEQQYADFLNTLTSTQINTLGVAGTGITLSVGQYFSSTPNKACGNSTPARLLSYADWSGIRPISFLEFNKASYGPEQPIFTNLIWDANFGLKGYPAWRASSFPNGLTGIVRDAGASSSSTSTRETSGSSYYGVMELTGNLREPVIKLHGFDFSTSNGNGFLSAEGKSDISTWLSNDNLSYVDQCLTKFWSPTFRGFRYCRSAE